MRPYLIRWTEIISKHVVFVFSSPKWAVLPISFYNFPWTVIQLFHSAIYRFKLIFNSDRYLQLIFNTENFNYAYKFCPPPIDPEVGLPRSLARTESESSLTKTYFSFFSGDSVNCEPPLHIIDQTEEFSSLFNCHNI